MAETTTLDEGWEDPLPHTHAPRKAYLSHLRRGGKTRAVVVFLHGRGDSIDDMVGIFLPVLAQRYGGQADVLRDDDDDDEQCAVACIGLEARDNVWYPASHHAREDDAKRNAAYQHSALDRLRGVMIDVILNYHVPPARIAVVGFSQGALLADAYMMAVLQQQQREDDRTTPLLPVPAHILSLAGSLFAQQPTFPARHFATQDERDAFEAAVKEERKAAAAAAAAAALTMTTTTTATADLLTRFVSPSTTVDMLCGTADRFFPVQEIKDAAIALAQAKTTAIEQASHDSLAYRAAQGLEVRVGLEPNAPHQITERMMAATVAAIDAMLKEG